jgi:hypothetical protein
MKKHGDTIEYSKAEQDAVAKRDALVEQGVPDRTTAARYALTGMHRPSKEFVEHLSDGTLTKADGKVVIVHTQPAA